MKNSKTLNEIGKSFYRSEGSIMYQPNGNIRLQLCYRDDSGKLRRKAFVSPTLTECYKRANRYAADCKGIVATEDTTIPEILRAKSEADLSMNYIKKQTHEGNLTAARSIERHMIGQLSICKITKEIIYDYMEYLSDYSDGTIDKLYRDVTNAFEIAKLDGVISKNPMKAYDMRKPKSNKSAKKVISMTEDEQRRFVEELKHRKVPYGSMDYSNQFFIQLYSGLRMGEVNALTPDDIDFTHHVIHVRNTVIQIKGSSELGESTKTYAGSRDVPISAALEPILVKAIRQAKENPYNLIFFDHKREKIISTSQASAVFNTYCRRCGINISGSHTLRHTFATRCIESGVPAVVLKKWLGHTDIHVTLDTYADVFDRMNNGAIDKLDRYMEKL